MLLLGCYRVHERPGAVPDATAHADASPVDAGTPDAVHCGIHGMTWPACTPELDAECQRRATAAALGRYAHSRCYQPNPSASGVECSQGLVCDEGATNCRCTPGRYCATDTDVCVSDTPDGPRYCARACFWSE